MNRYDIPKITHNTKYTNPAVIDTGNNRIYKNHIKQPITFSPF